MFSWSEEQLTGVFPPSPPLVGTLFIFQEMKKSTFWFSWFFTKNLWFWKRLTGLNCLLAFRWSWWYLQFLLFVSFL